MNYQLSFEEMKHNTEKTTANTDPETLHSIAGNIKKGWLVGYLQGSGHFQHLLQRCPVSSS
jgi:hypothetical protein